VSYLVRRQPNRGRPAGTSVQQLNGLSFPSNDDAPTDAFVAIKFVNPDTNGLPAYGPSDVGVTVIREVYCNTQGAETVNNSFYWAQFWWSEGNGDFELAYQYWGAHPFPRGGSPGTTNDPIWELSLRADFTDTDQGFGVKNDTEIGRWYTQAIIISKSGATVTGKLYIDLPSTAAGNIITGTNSAGTLPTTPQITIGDSPWFGFYTHERFSGILGRIKIIATGMSEADILSEAADMTQLVTTAAQNNIWWGKNNFESIDDLTCDYATGRSFVWADVNNKAALVAISS
jgi:hypothetical protein